MEKPYGRERPAKRHLDGDEGYSGRSSKRPPPPQNAASFGPSQAEGEVVYRMLCPGEKAGKVIGKNGIIIQEIRQQTGARITIHEAVRGTDERVVVISSPDDGDIGRVCPAQRALFEVHSRICGDEGSGRRADTRILVPRCQIGCLLGKGGKIMALIRQETGAYVKILPAPEYAPPSDEVVQISGELDVVRKALRNISDKLRVNPPKDRIQPPRSPVHSNTRLPPDALLPQKFGSPHRYYDGFEPQQRPHSMPPTPVPRYSTSRNLNPDMQDPYDSFSRLSPREELVYRLLCPDKKIGSVIGRGGNIIGRICEDIGVHVRITDSVPGTDDRILIISSIDVQHHDLAPAQEALLEIQRLSSGTDNGKDSHAIRLLVPSSHVGCLIGTGGSVISEMRRQTGASIRILPREDLPRCALETDELVEIEGDMREAQEALIQVSSRLRSYLHQSNHSTSTLPPPGNYADPQDNRMGYGHGLPRGPHSSAPTHQGGVHYSSAKHSAFPNSQAQYPSKHNLDAHNISNFSKFEEPHPSQRGASAFGRPRPASGFITNTTVEIVIPEYAIHTILGRSGNGLAEIEQITGAKLKLTDIRKVSLGASEAVLEIRGSSEETNAAQCMIEASLRNNKPTFR